MKTLIIAHYWHPFNSAGAFRWLNFSQEFDCEILTTKVPTNSKVDNTIKDPNKKTIRFGKNLPAIVWGLLASVRMLFMKYDRYIITSPPESLLFGAWLLQLTGRNVVVDMRDSIDRDRQPFKFMIPFYKFCYNRLKKVIVCWQFTDETKPCVYHGYEVEHSKPFRGYYTERVNHGEYIRLLKNGFAPDQSQKPKGYAASSLHSLIDLGFPINNDFHEEMSTIVPDSYKNRAKEMKRTIEMLEDEAK